MFDLLSQKTDRNIASYFDASIPQMSEKWGFIRKSPEPSVREYVFTAPISDWKYLSRKGKMCKKYCPSLISYIH